MSKINFLKTITVKDETWVESIRTQSLHHFELHDRKLDGYFQYAMVSASFIYGIGTLGTLPLLRSVETSRLWLAFLTLGVVGIMVAFALGSAYTYQWFDHARVLLNLIGTFYDEQKGDRSENPTVWRPVVPGGYWDHKFRDQLKSLDKEQGVFAENGATLYIDWMKAIGHIVSSPRPLMGMMDSFGRVVSVLRRPYAFVVYTLGSISLGVSYALAIANRSTLWYLFVGWSVVYLVFETIMYVMYGAMGARRVPIMR